MNEWAKQLAKDAALKADKPCENEWRCIRRQY
jgi:hypothetical protein